MARTELLGVRVDPVLKLRLVNAAKEEDRSLSSLLQRVLQAYLDARDKGVAFPPG